MVALAPPQAISRRIIENLERAFRDGDALAFEEAFRCNYVEHTPTGPIVGREPAFQALTGYRSGFSDLQLSAIERFIEADTVILRFAGRGTATGILHNLDQTGRSVKVTGTVVIRMSDGKAAEAWSVWEPSPMLRRLYVWRVDTDSPR